MVKGARAWLVVLLEGELVRLYQSVSAQLIDGSIKLPSHIRDIPLLGKLFRSYSNTKKRSDLLILLTPHIVGGEKLVTGEPSEDPAYGMKPYQDYSDLAVEPAKKSGWFHSLSGFFKGMLFLGRD